MKNTITRDQIDALMAASQIDVCTKFDKVTVVTVKLPNGFILVEASGAVSKENYSEDLGRKVCLDRIATKLWQFEGYLLSSRLAAASAAEPLAHVQASAATEENLTAVLAAVRPQLAPFEEGKPLSKEIVWMPAGTHEIQAHLATGGIWKDKVICDEAGAKSVIASFAAVLASGKRVRLDEAHDGDAATAWVTAFSWDPARGIIAHVEWTSLGEELVRGRVYTSFSPEFLVNKSTKRVAGLHAGRPAGGLVNEPAFGAAMPALIAARLAGAEYTVNQNQKTKTMNKDTLIKILAALKVEHSAEATEEQLTALVAKHVDQLPAAGAEGIALKAQLAELASLKAAEATRRKADAKKAVDAAVARGALPPKDEAIQAKWLGLIEADPSHAELLAAMPDSPALQRHTTPTAGIQAKDGLIDSLRIMAKVSTADVDQRAAIYARNISPLFKPEVDFNRELAIILAANSLASLSGELIAQRSMSLLKFTFPWFNRISTNFSDEQAKFGQKINTRLKVVPGLSTFVAGTGYVRQNAVTTDVDVTIDNNKAVEIAFNTNELGGTNRDLFGEQVEGCHYALGKGLVDSVLANITVANFANESIEAVADVDADTMDVLDAALGGRGVNGPRFGLFTSGAYRKLGKDSSLVSLAAFQMKEIITQSVLPPIKNIQPYELFNMPAPAGENLIGLAGTADALALATRLPGDYASIMPDVPSNGVVQTVKNLDTGISAMLVRYVDHKLAESAFRLALMWGSAVGNGASGQRLISAARE
jgi:phage I-like protein